jgi:hypothetical protein
MNHMNDKGIDQAAPVRDRGDTALDAALTATNIDMLAAIRQGLDLDGGLAQIIGAPPRLEMQTPEPPAENGESPQVSWEIY